MAERVEKTHASRLRRYNCNVSPPKRQHGPGSSDTVAIHGAPHLQLLRTVAGNMGYTVLPNDIAACAAYHSSE